MNSKEEKKMRKRLIQVTILVFLVGIALVAAASNNNQNTLTGVWELRATLNGQSVVFFVTYHDDGTLFATPPTSININAHGLWKKVGRRTFVEKNREFAADPNGELTLIAETTEIITLGDDKLSYTSDAVTEIQDFDGNVLSTFSYTIDATRMTLDL